MKLSDISNHINDWFSGAGPFSEIVISSRVRLARNLAGYKFLTKCSDEEKSEILEKLKKTILSLNLNAKCFYISVDKATKLDRNFLIERHLISQHHAVGKGPRGVVVSEGESFTAMINEEDHLRLQVLEPGSQLEKCLERINKIDDMIERKVEYAFSPRFGYLTACPTNLGTGIRVSVMLHLPALKMTGQIKKFFNATQAIGMAVRGLFGEGTESSGDFYQLSNQVTLGLSERDIVKQFSEQIIPELLEYENQAREVLLDKKKELLDDKISRAMALLNSAHLISSQEALFLLSHLRLGINMREKLDASTPAIDRLCEMMNLKPPVGKDTPQNLTIRKINRLFMLTLPAHLQMNYGRSLEPDRRDALRAKVIREELRNN